MSATFDATTKAAYDAATTAQSRAEAIVASLTGTITVTVYNGSNAAMGSGTMAAPWATAAAGIVTLGEVSSFTVGTTGTPDSNWYIRFENSDASRWVRGSFGLADSGQDYTWSLATWTATQTGTIGTATIIASGNSAPAFTVAPTTARIPATGGTIQFMAVDPDGSEVVYSLTTTRAGITINSTGLVTVTAAATGTSGNIVVRASDGILTVDATCAVTVGSVFGNYIKWNPGFYIFLAPPTVDGINGAYIDSAAARASNLTWFQTYANDPKIKGFVIHQYILSLERGNSVPAYDYVSESGGIRYGGFACIDYYLGLCATYGKRLAVHLKPHAFAGATALPAYWISQGWEHRYYGDFNSAANIGISACRDRYIALLQAYGSRYDTNPYLEFTSYGETTISLPVGVTAATWITNYKSILTAAASAWPSTMFRSNENGQINQATQKEVYEHIETLNNANTGCILTGGPDHEDTLIDPYNPGNEKSWVQLWRGETTSLGTVWKDVRGQMPRVGETQERGYSNPSFYQDTAANILTYQIDYMESSHVVFLNYNKWTETYAAITARNGLTDATVPTCLTGRTVTGGT